MNPLGPAGRGRLTVISDEVSQDLTETAAFVREFGMSGFELRSMFGRAFRDLTDADVAEIRRVISGEGWEIHGCASQVFKCELDDAGDVRGHADLFRRSLEIALALDCRLVRVFAFLRRPGCLTADLALKVADRLRPLCEVAVSAGVVVGIENEASCLVATPDEAAALLAALRHPAAGIVWDPCNILYLPGSRLGRVDFAASFGALARHIVHVHVKDAVRTPNAPGAVPGLGSAEAVPVGTGDVDWALQLGAMRRAGYMGRISLETHWRHRRLGDALLHRPAGGAFSAGGKEASRVCLSRLCDLWAQVWED
ncbi:MAG: sugar phosphate isomerase/epimerase family protein [Opitutaceae bacterium]